MEAKRLYYSTKMCHSTVCQNYHMNVVEKMEAIIMTLFDTHALNNRIVPKPTTISEATHMQYIDVNGTIHIRPSGMVVEPLHHPNGLRVISL